MCGNETASPSSLHSCRVYVQRFATDIGPTAPKAVRLWVAAQEFIKGRVSREAFGGATTDLVPRLPNRRHYRTLKTFFDSVDIENEHGYEDYLQMLDAVEQCTYRELLSQVEKTKQGQVSAAKKNDKQEWTTRKIQTCTSTPYVGGQCRSSRGRKSGASGVCHEIEVVDDAQIVQCWQTSVSGGAHL